MLNVENIKKGGKILAIILYSTTTNKNVEFVTPKDFGLQLGLHKRKKNDHVKAHSHVPFNNINIPSQEIFFVEKGRLLITLFDGKEKFKDVTISNGQVILINCGHSIKFLEDTVMVEVKQGPYRQKQFEKIDLE